MPVWGIILIVIGAVLCCGLCAYGINTAIRRARERRDREAHALTS
jgi:hypothetical protein